ncbi:MAG: IgGFc-binding protein [Polyangiales bacterium]
MSIRAKVLLASALVTAACSDGAPPCAMTVVGCPVDGSRGDGSSGMDATGADDGAVAGDGMAMDAIDAGRADAPLVGAGCSADLREVLDVNGVAIGRCADDQGCSMGRCIAACEAASASRGSIACEFYAPTPPAYPPALPPCHAMFVTNTWSKPARITVTRGATTFDVTRFGRIVENGRPANLWAPIPADGIPVDSVAVLFLSSDPMSVMPETGTPLSCPITPAVNASTVLSGTGQNAAWRVQSDVPIGAYDMMPYGGAPSFFPSAQLVFPTSVYGQSYVVMNAPVGTASAPGPQWFQIVSTADDTVVRIRPTQDFAGRAPLPALTRGVTTSITLAAGQVAQYEVRGDADPSGTIIATDRPIAVFAGNRFLRLQPMEAPGGDSTHQQQLPINALSSEYVGAPYETRRRDLMPESVPYRLVGAVDGTTLVFDPPIAGAPATLSRGQIADFRTESSFIVRSQDAMHPFAFAQMMTSSTVPSGSRPGALEPYQGRLLGDEEFVIVMPPAQFLRRYVFFSDPSYPTTSLTIVRERRMNGTFAPVNIDCIGDVSGFRPVGSTGRYEMTTVDLLRAGMSATGCTNGRHTATSDGAFGITVWGMDSYSSYAYPAGGNAATLADIPIPL